MSEANGKSTDGPPDGAIVTWERVTTAIEPTTGLVTARLAKAAMDHLGAWTAGKRLLAIHEAGHASLCCLLGIGIKEIDIKGSAHGHTLTTVGDDDEMPFVVASRMRHLMTAKLGGYHAELRLFGEVSVASQIDTSQVCNMALSYATTWMDGTVILPSSPWGYSTIPPSVLDRQVEEVNRIVRDAYEQARSLVEANESKILELARVIYAQRRLSDGALDAALRAAGFEPAAPAPDDE